MRHHPHAKNLFQPGGRNSMSNKPRILASRRLPPAVTKRLQRDYDAILNEDDRIHSREELLGKLDGCNGVICTSSERFDAETIACLPEGLRAIATFSVGYNHIDVAAANARGLVVTNTPDVLTDATADITLLCLLGAARRAYEGQRMLRAGQWHGWTTTQLLGTHVTGKRLGVLGMGRIGRAVAQRARGFSMTIHYCNRSRLTPDLEQGAVYHADPEDMLPHCDFLSLNCPATPETVGFLNEARIERLPAGAIVVNSSRGDVVVDDALIAALRSGRLSAAGLDVFTNEPKLDPRYLELDNAFLLPHLGSATTETRDAMGFTCLDNLDAVFAGRQAPNRLFQ